MPTATETTTQIYKLFIRATPQAIWDAITKPEFTSQYFHGAHVETTGEAGTPLRYRSPDGSTLWGDETIIESDPPRRLVVPWRSMYSPELAEEEPSRVTWEIEPRENGVSLLTVIHDRLENSPKTAASVGGEGWMMVLSGLKTVLETGGPLNA
jgi:uncharacterized protein YndB with AHSA1/START domain